MRPSIILPLLFLTSLPIVASLNDHLLPADLPPEFFDINADFNLDDALHNPKTLRPQSVELQKLVKAPNPVQILACHERNYVDCEEYRINVEVDMNEGGMNSLRCHKLLLPVRSLRVPSFGKGWNCWFFLNAKCGGNGYLVDRNMTDLEEAGESIGSFVCEPRWWCLEF